MWFKNFVRNNLFFLLPFVFFVIIGGVLLSLYTKETLLIAVNSRYSSAGDVFFKYYTHWGDGATFLVLSGLVLLFISKYKGLVMVACYAMSTIPVQIIKYNFPGHNFRPRSHFWLDSHRLHFPDGVEILVAHSFPSGHTAAAFSMFLVFSYFAKNRALSLLFFGLALLVGYSRMYLAAHFFADVYGGALISVPMTIMVIYLLENVFKLSEKDSLRKGFIN